MKFGLNIAQHGMSWDDLAARANMAEGLGFDGVWGFDHLIWQQGSLSGTFEGMTTLAGLAATTSTVRLGLLVANVTLRSPAMLASQVATIDHISGGRLNVGLGIGWDEEEHRALGLPFPSTDDRYERLVGTLACLKKSLAGRSATTGSEARGGLAVPVQRPHPPIWIGGAGPRRTLPIAAWFADAWHAYGTPELLATRMSRLDELARAAGRDPASILRASSLSISESVATIDDRVQEWADNGWGYLVCDWPGQGASAVRRFAEAVLPRHL